MAEHHNLTTDCIPKFKLQYVCYIAVLNQLHTFTHVWG